MGFLTDTALDSGALNARIKATAMADIGNLLPQWTASGGELGEPSTTIRATAYHAPAAIPLTPSSTQVYSGTRSLSCTTVSEGMHYLFFAGTYGTRPDLPIKSNKTYTFRAWVWSSESIDFRVIWWSATAQISYTSITYPGTSSWQLVEQVVTAPANAAFVNAYLVRVSGASGVTFYADQPGIWEGSGGDWQMPGVPIPGLRQVTQIASATAAVTMSPLQDALTVDTTSGAVTVTLPSAALCTGQTKRIVKTGGVNTLTISRAGSDTITPSSGTRTSVAFPAATFGELVLVSSGTSWHVVSGQASDESVGRRLWEWDQALAGASTSATVGWQLVYGDTGLRDLSALLINGWTATLLLGSRVDNRVEFEMQGLNGSAATNDVFLPASVLGTPRVSGNFAAVGVVTNAFNGTTAHSLYYSAPALGYAAQRGVVTSGYGRIGWFTSSAWPTSLPGTAVGSIPT